MTSKIVRSDGVTELLGIKSVVYTETVNSGNNLTPGCVASASIDVEVFGTQPNAPAADEALMYYQVDENGNETLIGTFYAEPSIPTKNTYKFIAYDAASKLDKSFSERLNAIQNDFPMTVYDIVSEACTVAGVTLGSSSWPLSTQMVQAFYADNLTCRNILQYAAEIAGRFVRCNTNGEIIFDWYTSNSDYSIHPDAEQTGYIAYKQNGLTYDNFTVIRVDSVAVRPSGSEGAAYIYPTSFSSVTADDPNGDGNIVLQNLTVTDDGNGNLVLSVGATDANADGNVHVGSGGAAANTLVIGNNLLLMNASAVTYNAVAQNLYNVMSALPSYRHATVQLFTGENPFRAGEFVSVTDAQGVSFTTPIFTMKSQASHAEIRSSGDRTYQLEKASTEKALANLAGNIVQLEKLKVGYAEIDTAIVDSLQVHGINADWIDTGSLTIKDADDHILFKGDVADNAVRLALWEVSENAMKPVSSSDTSRDSLLWTHNIHTNAGTAWSQLGGKAITSEGENIMFINGVSFNGVVVNFTSLDGVMDGLSVPRTIWSNNSPGNGMAAQTLTINDPASGVWTQPLKAPSHFNMFYIEVCYSTTYTSHRNGTWVYVPSGTTVRAHPSVDWYEGSYAAHVYRIVTIENGAISIGTGNQATGTGVTEGSAYAVPTRIIAMRVTDSLFQ